MNIKYIKTAFSADCSKNFDGKNMVQIMGKICPIYVPYFAHGVFTLPAFRLTCRFQFTLPHRSDRQNVPVSLYSFEFQFTLLCRSDSCTGEHNYHGVISIRTPIQE